MSLNIMYILCSDAFTQHVYEKHSCYCTCQYFDTIDSWLVYCIYIALFLSINDHNNINIIILTSNNEYFEVHCDNCVVPPKVVVVSFIILQFWNLVLLLRLHLSLSNNFSNSWYTEFLLLNFLFRKLSIQNSWWMPLPKAEAEQVLMQPIIKQAFPKLETPQLRGKPTVPAASTRGKWNTCEW